MVYCQLLTMLRLLCLLALTGVSLGDQVVLDQLVDQLLAGLSQQVTIAGKDTLTVSGMNHDWQYRWHMIKLSGHCNCDKGYARSLASIHRTGDVVMTTNGNAITLKVALGLGTLEFGFHSCQLKAKHLLSATQQVHASVSSNSIAAQVTVVKNGAQCTSNVDQLALVNLGHIKLKTGSSVLHKIEDKLINWLVGKFHGEIKNRVDSALQQAARDSVNKADLCSKLPFRT